MVQRKADMPNSRVECPLMTQSGSPRRALRELRRDWTRPLDFRNARSYRGLNKYIGRVSPRRRNAQANHCPGCNSWILVAGSLVGKAEATTVTGVGGLLPLTRSSSLVANIACWCGQYQCACRGPVRGAVRGTAKATATVGRGVVKGTAIAGRGIVVGTGPCHGWSCQRDCHSS
jgi:hypothetical protein